MDRSCEVCGSDRLAAIGGRGAAAYRCERCDSVSLAELRPLAYQRSYFTDSYLAVRDERVAFFRRLLAGVDASGTVIDVGAGAGFALEALDASGTLVAVDASEAATRLARERGHVVSMAEADALPFRDGTASAVLLLDVLAHVMSPRSVLAESIRVLRSKGTMVLKTPYRPPRVYAFAARVPRRLAASMIHSSRQLHSLSPQGLALALEDLDMDVMKSFASDEALGLRGRWRAGARAGLLSDALTNALARHPSWVVWARKR